MARPLPDDLEKQIADTAKRSEVRSVAIFSFILGGIVGFAIATGLDVDTGGSVPFFVVVGVVAILWGGAIFRRTSLNKKDT